MPNSKGSFFVGLKQFVIARFGEAGWQKLLMALPEPDRKPVATAVSIAWMDVTLRTKALHALVDTLGEGNREICVLFGRFDGERDLTTTQKFVLRVVSPGYALEKSGQYWSRFSDWGELAVDRPTKTQANATLRNSVVADELFCLHLVGYMTRFMELAGARDVKIAHTRCRARGERDCLYEGSWR
jgi:hypothetical protein